MYALFSIDAFLKYVKINISYILLSQVQIHSDASFNCKINIYERKLSEIINSLYFKQI